MSKLMSRKGRKGFTLVELAVVIVIIGVLASFGVPKFMQSVERSKAAEAFNFMSAVQASQERYQAQYGNYTTDYASLDISWKGLTAGTAATTLQLQYFSAGIITVVGGTGTSTTNTWTATCTRTGAAGAYGAYTVVFTQDGFDGGPNATPAGTSTIPATIAPVTMAAASS